VAYLLAIFGHGGSASVYLSLLVCYLCKRLISLNAFVVKREWYLLCAQKMERVVDCKCQIRIINTAEYGITQCEILRVHSSSLDRFRSS